MLAVVGFAWAGRSFLPEFNEGTLTVSAVTLPGTALAESDGLGRRVEEILLREPEVVAHHCAAAGMVVGRISGREWP